jgi:adenylosuccinate lyase
LAFALIVIKKVSDGAHPTQRTLPPRWPSPLDGRYQSKLDPLRPYFSEYALIRHRMLVEVEWLKALANDAAIKEIAPFSVQTIKEIDDAIAKFGETEAAQVKAIEVRTYQP